MIELLIIAWTLIAIQIVTIIIQICINRGYPACERFEKYNDKLANINVVYGLFVIGFCFTSIEIELVCG